MKILIAVDCYLPSTISSAKLVHDLSLELTSQGHNVTVVTPDEKLGKSCDITIEEDITVFRVRTGPIKNAPIIQRGINEAKLSRTIWKEGKSYFKSNPSDLIIFYSPSIFFGPLVKRLKKLWNCKSYLILRDIFPKWAVDAGVFRKGPAYYLLKLVEKQQYKAADIIAVQSPANLDYFDGSKFAVDKKLEVLYNWFRDGERQPLNQNYRKKLGLEDKVVFFYGGNIGVAQDMDCIVRLARSMSSHQNAYLLLVGQGSEVERLNKLIESLGLSNISILPAVDQSEYFAMLSEFDVGLIALDGNLKTHNFPGKMLGYMAYSKPLLASINPGNDLETIISNAQAGFVSYAGQDGKLYKSAVQLLDDPELRKKTGKNARNLLDSTFSAFSAAKQIIKSVQQQ